MSIQLMTKVWAMTIAENYKFVLLSLADQANDDGVCWPSMETIAARCSVSKRTVMRAIDGLVQLDLLTVDARRNQATIYRVHLDGRPKVESVESDKLSPIESDKLSPIESDKLSSEGDKLSSESDNLSLLHTRTQRNPKETPTRVREDGFEFVWKAYPRKTCKAEARNVWKRLGGGEALTGRMLAWIAAQQQTEQWQRGIVPHLRTVLHQRRFEDPLPSEVAAEATAHGHRCHCGERATVTFENQRYCRAHNPARL